MELYINSEPVSIKEYGPLYPINTWTSLIYIIIAPFIFNKCKFTSFVSICMGIVSFLWWYSQNNYIQLLDLSLITYLFIWPYLFINNISYRINFSILIIIISCIFVDYIFVDYNFNYNFNFRYFLPKIHTCFVSISGYSLLKHKLYIHVLLFIIGSLIKWYITIYGTGIFHIITGITIFLITNKNKTKITLIT